MSSRCGSTGDMTPKATRQRLAERLLDDAIIAKKRKRGEAKGKNPQPMGMRWPVERTNAWLAAYGQLRRNTDRKPIHRLARFALAVAFMLTAMLIDGRIFALGILVSIGTLLGTIAVFCAVGLVFAAFVVVFKRGEVLAGFVAASLSILGGVFYPVSRLPPVLRDVGNILPFTWAVEVFRGALLTHQLLFVPFVELFVFAVVAFPLAIVLFDGALRHARRHATLAQY